MDNPWIVALVIAALCLSSSCGALVAWLVMRGILTNTMRLLSRSQRQVLALSEKPSAAQLALMELSREPEIGPENPWRGRVDSLRRQDPDDVLAGEG